MCGALGGGRWGITGTTSNGILRNAAILHLQNVAECCVVFSENASLLGKALIYYLSFYLYHFKIIDMSVVKTKETMIGEFMMIAKNFLKGCRER